MLLQTRVTADPLAPSIARRVLEPLAEKLPRSAVEVIQLLITELVTNSIRHADFSRGSFIELEVELTDAGVRARVCDPGSGTTPKMREPDLEAIGGRGLMLLDAMVAEWGVEQNGRTCVWFVIPS